MERSKAAKFATSVFYESFNDFDIYIEDTAPGYPKIIASIFSRAMDNNVALDRVFPLGQRGDVIKAARQRLMQNARPAAYLVDGDLYMLAGEREQLPSNVVVLPRYCIENFMLDELALVEVMDEEHPSMSHEDLRANFDYPGWLDRSTAGLKELFRFFAVAHHLKSGVQTVARTYSSVCAGGEGEIDLAKCNKIIEEIKEHLIAHYGAAAVEEALAYVDAKIEPEKCFVTTYVSAKDFSLPLVLLRMKSVVPIKASNINLKMRISRKCSVNPFLDVAQKISAVVS
jgi:hypothetical protein